MQHCLLQAMQKLWLTLQARMEVIFKSQLKKSLENYLEEILIHVLPFDTLGFLFARFSHSQED